jgi:hypothetical protein
MIFVSLVIISFAGCVLAGDYPPAYPFDNNVAEAGGKNISF